MVRAVKFELKDFSDSSMIKEGTKLFNWYIKRIIKLKTCSKSTLHHKTYREARKLFPTLKSAQVQSIRDHAVEVAKRRRLHEDNKKFSSRKTLSMRVDKRCFSFKGTSIKYSTPHGVKEESITVLPFQARWVQGKVKSMVIKYASGRWWACVAFEHEAPPAPREGESRGVDLGLRNIATLSNGKIYSASRLNAVRRRYNYQRRVLQSKGTCSAKRRLKVLAGRERRFTTNTLHCVTKVLVGEGNVRHFVVEDLVGIRQRGRGRRFNRRLSQWPFSQFYNFLSYKAEQEGKTVEKVDARYTSQRCFVCRKVKKSNRKGSFYHCGSCAYANHADINAALNIQSLSNIRQGQAAVNRPNGLRQQPNVALKVIMPYSTSDRRQAFGDVTQLQATWPRASGS